jgi:putative ABC transport system substrate-binding protein
MNRRDAVLALIALGAAPLVTRAQQQGRSYRIGSAYVAVSAQTKPYEEQYLAGLRELGFEVGRNLIYDVRNCEGDPARLPAAIDELLALKPDLLFGIEAVARIMRSKTATIPIVLTLSSDPVAAGLVKSLRRPGGNVTGNASLDGPMLTKQVELLSELLPRMASIAMLIDPGIPAGASIVEEVRTAAKTRRARLITYQVPDRAALENALKEMERNRPDALLNGMSSGLLFQNRQFTYETALRLRIPAAGNVAAGAEAGALFSLGVNLHHEFRRAATHAARILRGANPGDLPVEQPTRFEMVINLKTAKALGIKIPQSVLIRADRVIE